MTKYERRPVRAGRRSSRPKGPGPCLVGPSRITDLPSNMAENDRRESDRPPSGSNGKKVVFTPYIHRNGKKIWHPEWPPGVFRFEVDESDEQDS